MFPARRTRPPDPDRTHRPKAGIRRARSRAAPRSAPVAAPANASLQHRSHVERAADLAHVHLAPLVLKGRGPRGDPQAVHLTQSGDQLIGEPVAEVFLVVSRAQVGEGEHGRGRGDAALAASCARERPTTMAAIRTATRAAPARTSRMAGRSLHRFAAGLNAYLSGQRLRELSRGGEPIGRRSGESALTVLSRAGGIRRRPRPSPFLGRDWSSPRPRVSGGSSSLCVLGVLASLLVASSTGAATIQRPGQRRFDMKTIRRGAIRKPGWRRSPSTKKRATST